MAQPNAVNPVAAAPVPAALPTTIEIRSLTNVEQKTDGAAKPPLTTPPADSDREAADLQATQKKPPLSPPETAKANDQGVAQLTDDNETLDADDLPADQGVEPPKAPANTPAPAAVPNPPVAADQGQIVVQPQAPAPAPAPAAPLALQNPPGDGQVLFVVPPHAPAPAPAPAPRVPPPNAAAEIARIQALVQANSPDVSTQELLKQIVKGLHDLGYKPEISWQVGSKPKTFTMKEAPEKTYYQTGVTFQIKVPHIENFPDINDISLNREMLTTATEPEKSRAAVGLHAKFLSQIALASTGAANATLLEGYPADQAKQNDIYSQKTFRYLMNYTKEGKQTTLNAIHFEKGKDSFEFKLKPETDYVYQRDLRTQEIKKVSKDSPPRPGHIVYKTEEEALLDAQYEIQHDEAYERFEKNSTDHQTQLKAIKDEINRKNQEIANQKAIFFEKAHIWSKDALKETEQFKQLQADNLALENDLKLKSNDEDVLKEAIKEKASINAESLTSVGQAWLVARSAFEDLEKENGSKAEIEADIALLENFVSAQPPRALSDIENRRITALAVKYKKNTILNPASGQPALADLDKAKECLKLRNEDLKEIDKFEKDQKLYYNEVIQNQQQYSQVVSGMQAANQALRSDLAHLEKLVEGAKAKRQDPHISKEDKVRAEAVLKEITDSSLKLIRNKIGENQRVIDSIVNKLSAEEIKVGDAFG